MGEWRERGKTMTIEDLSARLEKVERANRRMRAAGVAALVLLAAGAAIGQTAPAAKEIRAERFTVVDREGRERVLLATQPNGTYGFWLIGRNGKPSGTFGQPEGGVPAISLRDDDDNTRLSLMATVDGTAGLCLYDKKGTRRGEFFSMLGGPSALTLADRSGRTRVVLGVDEHDVSGLAIEDKDGKVLARLPR
jgi:hypothetical protein